jgi:hypothetical protein
MPDLVYPKTGAMFLMSRVTELHANVADLIDELVKKDQQIAGKDAEIADLKQKLNGHADSRPNP